MTKKYFKYVILILIAICFLGYMTSVMFFNGRENGFIAGNQTDAMFGVFVLCFVLLFCLLLFATVYLTKKKDSFRIEKLYLVSSLVLSFIMSLILPVMSVPDEEVHLLNAYNLSNKMLGIELDDSMIARGNELGIIYAEGETLIPVRIEDISFSFDRVEIRRAYMNRYYDEMFEKATETELVAVKDTESKGYWFLYLFSAIGITIGRKLGFGIVLTYLLGRWCNALFFTILTYFAIKKMPFAKGTVFVWGLLPIMLQQSASYSYDCFINALCILVISTTMFFMYREPGEYLENKKQKVHYYFQIALLVFAALLLAKCKGHALILVSMLPLAILVRMVYRKRDKLKKGITENKKIRIGVMLGGVMLAIALIVVAIVGIRTIRTLMLPENINTNYIAWAESYGYTIGYIFTNPVGFVNILLNTFWSCGDALLSQALGGTLGNLDIHIPTILVLPFLFLLILSGMRAKDEDVMIAMPTRIWFVLVWMGSCLLAILAMFLYWTPNTVSFVTGVQGRYFLPALVPALMVLRALPVTTNKNTDRFVSYGTIYMYVFIIITVARDYMA